MKNDLGLYSNLVLLINIGMGNLVIFSLVKLLQKLLVLIISISYNPLRG